MSDPDGPVVLPEGVRRRLTDLAAAVLGALPAEEVPPSLRRVRSFAPTRRARTGGTPLGVALDREPLFRHSVAVAWREQHPLLADALLDGQLPGATDPEVAVVGAYLLRPPGWQPLVEALVRELERVRDEAFVRDEGVVARESAKVLRQELDELRDTLAEERRQAASLEEEISTLRREARKLRADADRSRAQARAAEAELKAATERNAELAVAAEDAETRARERVRDAEERVEQARRASRERRSLDDARLRLLLDTLVESSAGLRRELALPPPSVRPADLVDAADLQPRARTVTVEDPAELVELLSLPQVHLIVDGYNVTKEGFGALPLADQRQRLVQALGPLAARTAAEVTCCFDGGEVDAPPPARVRGVRVLFSEPGVSADQLIGRLVRAEPPGRPVVVVSSDREVAADSRALAARPVQSSTLLRVLART